jgi:hypothetical protein
MIEQNIDLFASDEFDYVDPEAPKCFPMFDEMIETEYQCPACKYQWSGQPKPIVSDVMLDELSAEDMLP